MTKLFWVAIAGIVLSFEFPVKGDAGVLPSAVGAGRFSLKASNQTALYRHDEIISLDVAQLQKKYPSFNPRSFMVTYKGEELPSQFDSSRSLHSSGSILILSSFAPRQTKTLKVSWPVERSVVHHFHKMAQATIGVKVDYTKTNGYYTGGRFVDVDSTTVPKDHFAHDALYRMEGPGWESDRIAYRFYLDSRNRNDIFGKRVKRLVLKELGEKDLVSNSMESYTRMLDWGMDIFKVGESLGIGSIAMWHDSKVETVSDVRRIRCEVSEDGPILAGIRTTYLGWNIGGDLFDMESHLSIGAGSRLTSVVVDLHGRPVDLCTGLAKHDSCEFIRSTSRARGGWSYIGVYGKQSLAGDNLGTAVFFRSENAVSMAEDSLSWIVVLKPENGRLNYLFAAAWEKEPGGIRNVREFRRYLRETEIKLETPIVISF